MRACEPGTGSPAAREGRERRERGPRAEGAAPLPAPTALPHRTREPSPQVCAASAGRARHASASLLKSERPGSPPPPTHTHTCTSTSGSWDSPPLHARPASGSRSHGTRLSPAPGSLPSYPLSPCARQLTTPAPQRHGGDPSSPPQVEGQGTQLPSAHPAKYSRAQGRRGARYTHPVRHWNPPTHPQGRFSQPSTHVAYAPLWHAHLHTPVTSMPRKETEAQRRDSTCPRSHGLWGRALLPLNLEQSRAPRPREQFTPGPTLHSVTGVLELAPRRVPQPRKLAAGCPLSLGSGHPERVPA